MLAASEDQAPWIPPSSQRPKQELCQRGRFWGGDATPKSCSVPRSWAGTTCTADTCPEWPR